MPELNEKITTYLAKTSAMRQIALEFTAEIKDTHALIQKAVEENSELISRDELIALRYSAYGLDTYQIGFAKLMWELRAECDQLIIKRGLNLTSTKPKVSAKLAPTPKFKGLTSMSDEQRALLMDLLNKK